MTPLHLPDDERWTGALRLCQRLTHAGHRALLAGGCVRDLLLGEVPKDYDIATSARPGEVARLLDRTIPVGAAFGVTLVVTPEGTYEVTTFRQDGPYRDGRHPEYVEYRSEIEDAKRRDFTINAMFFDPDTGSVLDYVGGREDLQRRCVRAVGDPAQRFAEDHLRMLRAVRFAARLDYALDPATAVAICALAPAILRTSAERIRDEIIKLLTEGGAARGLRLMDELGLLHPILPEIEAMKGIEQPPGYHPEGDVFTHTLLMLDHLANPSPTLALGALLHDVGKPVTQTFEDRIRFNNHDRVGADMAHAICRRLRLPRVDAERIVWLVAQHMRLGVVPEMKESKRKRLVREPGFPELLELGRADCLASHGDVSTIDWIEGYIGALKPEEARPKPLITGRDLIQLGYTPGPKFGEILAAVEDEQLEGRLTTPDQATAYVLEHWP